MSGDVQPRKRKDKKRKKDELGIEEPRGTAAVFGEGDVFMHSQHDHGTGGHWCAKVIFFSLLAILVGLIGLIILENRGLSELEANAVESRYSGVLEGWLEDAPDDDHHDEHTLELNHHDDEHEEDDEDDEEVEVEKLEKEASEEDLEPVSTELPALPEEDDDDDNKDEDQSYEKEPEEEDSGIEDEGEEFLEVDDADEPPVEKISAPAGKPFFEVEEEVSSEQPPDTLEEEEEYEKQQEQLRREEAQASHMWLKLGVGAALLVATHAVMRRATHSRDTPEREEHASREETPIVDRRLTLIPEEAPAPVRKVEELSRPVIERVVEKVEPIVKSIPIRKQESEEEEEEPQPSEDEEEEVVIAKSKQDKELYSDEEADEEVEEEEEEIVPVKKEIPKPAPLVSKKPEPEPEPEPEEEDDEDPEDVEIIGDEQLEEELEEEGDEEEISDVDDAELLSRLEAKYGKLPEPERPGQKQKDGGNSLEDMWPGEPSDPYWRQQLDSAEQELRQDWLD